MTESTTKAVTLRAVATKCGVSTTTVSMVLNRAPLATYIPEHSIAKKLLRHRLAKCLVTKLQAHCTHRLRIFASDVAELILSVRGRS